MSNIFDVDKLKEFGKIPAKEVQAASRSKAGVKYTVEVYKKNGKLEFECNCIAGSMGKFCKHKKEIKNNYD